MSISDIEMSMLCMLDNIECFVFVFQNKLLKKNLSGYQTVWIQIKVQHFVQPGLSSNCLQKISAVKSYAIIVHIPRQGEKKKDLVIYDLAWTGHNTLFDNQQFSGSTVFHAGH